MVVNDISSTKNSANNEKTKKDDCIVIITQQEVDEDEDEYRNDDPDYDELISSEDEMVKRPKRKRGRKRKNFDPSIMSSASIDKQLKEESSSGLSPPKRPRKVKIEKMDFYAEFEANRARLTRANRKKFRVSFVDIIFK